jgi:hypothetical protein
VRIIKISRIIDQLINSKNYNSISLHTRVSLLHWSKLCYCSVKERCTLLYTRLHDIVQHISIIWGDRKPSPCKLVNYQSRSDGFKEKTHAEHISSAASRRAYLDGGVLTEDYWDRVSTRSRIPAISACVFKFLSKHTTIGDKSPQFLRYGKQNTVVCHRMIGGGAPTVIFRRQWRVGFSAAARRYQH